MLRLSLFILFILVMGGFSAQAQQSAAASASVNIVTPLHIVKVNDLDFGNIAVNNNNAGNVVLAPTGSRVVTGGATAPASSGNVAAASFTVTGESSYTYSITLPSQPVVLNSGANSMSVDNFVSAPSNTGTLSNSSQTLKVGATLHVSAGQTPGLYTSSVPFEVTVNYN